MDASSKLDLSARPDRSPYTCRLRKMNGGTSLKRSSSFRESMEKPTLSSLPNLSRSSQRATQGDILRSRKFSPPIAFRRRSRKDVISSDYAKSVPLNGRSGGGLRTMMIETTDHDSTNTPEVEIKKSEDRIKNTKRAKTSLLTVRDPQANSLASHSSLIDRDGRWGASSGVVLGNEHELSIKSWESSKMKKKRTGTKADVSPSTSSFKPVDGLSEMKQGMRKRLANGSLRFRSGVSNGAFVSRKLDGELQHSDFSVQSFIAKLDDQNGSISGHNKEKISNEEINLRTVNKTMRENTKLIAAGRAPRSNRGTLPNMSARSQQPITSDKEISQCINKSFAASGPTIRKRKPSGQSSSSPDAHLAGQRPQKISCAARRTNVLPIVANNHKTLAFDDMSDAGIDNGFVSRKPLPSISDQQDKLENEILSESEEAGVVNTKNEKTKKKMTLAKADGSAAHDVKRAPNLVFSAENKLIDVEKLEDGYQSQGRKTQNLALSRSLIPTINKLGKVGRTIQHRTKRTDLDKAVRKSGCPSMRKLRIYAVNAAADFCDDGPQELLAPAKAAVDPSHLSLFWRHMELVFRSISEADIGFLKQQMGEVVSISDTPNTDDDSAANCLNIFTHTSLRHTPEECVSEATSPLCQRLLAALIPDEYGNGRVEETGLDSYEPGFPFYAELEPGALSDGSAGNCYSHVSKASTRSHTVSIQNFGGVSSSGCLFDGPVSGSEMIPITETAECQYVNMPISERLLLELQSIGIFPEQPEMMEVDNNEVAEELRHLGNEYHQKFAKKKHFMLNLLKSASQSKGLQENDFEDLALEKLVIMTYGKYMTPAGVHGAADKMMKQATSAFVNRTLEFCKRYENCGISCSQEPLFKDFFNATLNKLTETETVDGTTDSENVSDRCYSYKPSEEPSPEQDISKQDTCSNKMMKEYSLNVIGSSIVPKRKRSDRGRNGKGQARNFVSENGKAKLGLSVSSNNRDKKPKAEESQRMTELSSSVNGLNPKGSVSLLPCENMTDNIAKETEDSGINGMDDPAVDSTSLEVPEIDVYLGGQGQDLASWLHIDDDLFPNHDFMGLEIPMDDLSDVSEGDASARTVSEDKEIWQEEFFPHDIDICNAP